MSLMLCVHLGISYTSQGLAKLISEGVLAGDWFDIVQVRTMPFQGILTQGKLEREEEREKKREEEGWRMRETLTLTRL